MKGTDYTLLPYVREGFQPDRQFSPGGSLSGRSTFGVCTDVEAQKRDGSGTETRTAEVDLRVYGPGDVTGIDRRQVVRTVPREDTSTFPPNYFPHVEFSRPDLPWLFSPERADGDGRVRPWLTLVVVPRDAAKVEPPGRRPNPALTAPAAELPPVGETWAWAHVQAVGDVTTAGTDDRKRLFTERSDQTVSRLVCPRKLSTGTKYVACVVPAFEPGRRVGLGDDPFEDAKGEPPVEPAWEAGAGEVTLPVFYRWEFSTGDRGDFEAAVDELSPRNLSKPKYDVGVREFDLSEPGPAPLRDPGGLTAKMSGALKTVGIDFGGWNRSTQETLHGLLTDPDSLPGIKSRATDMPVVGPPSYGQYPPLALDWPADPGPRLEWLAELNLTARYRVAAGLGAKVIREHQDQLVADAWEQFSNLTDATVSHVSRRSLGRETRDLVSEALKGADLPRTYREIERARFGVRAGALLDELDQKAVGTGGSTGGPGGGGAVGGGKTTGVGGGSKATKFTMATMGSEFASFVGDVGLARDARRFRNEVRTPVTTPDGGRAFDAGVPTFGSLSRLDALARPGKPLSRRTAEGVDPAEAFETLFDDPTDRSGTTPERAPSVEPVDWIVDEDGNRTSLQEAVESVDDERAAAPKALLQLRSIRDDARAVGSRLSALRRGIDDPDRSNAGAVALESPPLVEQVTVLTDALEAGHRSLAKLLAAEDPPVTAELTRERGDGAFDRMRSSLSELSEVVDRIDAAARADGRPPEGRPDDPTDGGDPPGRTDGGAGDPGSTGGGSTAGSPGVDREDVLAARSAAEALADEAAELAGSIPTERVVEEGSGGESGGGSPTGSPTAPTEPLFGTLPDSDALPGVLDGGGWAVAKTTSGVFDAGLSQSARSGTAGVMTGGPMAAPEFDWPMYEPLKELSTDYILPGVGNVPNNTIGALSTNDKFVEAYMAGLSHEFARELLWRGFPTDRRGTYFQRFWNYDGPGEGKPEHDVRKIHTWDGDLGSNAPGDAGPNAPGGSVGNRVVLLLKGDLLRAFPNTRVYAVPAVAEPQADAGSSGDGDDVWDRKPLLEGEDFDDLPAPPYGKGVVPEGVPKNDQGKRVPGPKEPILRGKLGEDVTFMMFDLEVDVARGEPMQFGKSAKVDLTGNGRTRSVPVPTNPESLGWFFVFEEPVGEVRFGLDANDEYRGPDEEKIGKAAHPGKPGSQKYDDYESLVTDVGGYPAKVTLGQDQGGAIERREENEPQSKTLTTMGVGPWKKDLGEEKGWSGLSWGHLVRHGDVPSPGGDRQQRLRAEQSLVDGITHVRVSGPKSHAPGGVNDGIDASGRAWKTDDAEWGHNSAHMARITWQHPVRVAYHTDDLLPRDAAAHQDGVELDPDAFENVDLESVENAGGGGIDWTDVGGGS